ncbi:MAG: hypothetical protein GY828_02815 [Candidatus Gracilibacteria bacterium]|nr:hypothetical protein [Candidatus Gracilibacteria bacterium]
MYGTQIEYLSKEDSEYVFKNILRLSMNKDIKIEESMRGGLVLSIRREAVQMENKARAKKGNKRLEIDVATLMCDTESDVIENNVRPSQVKSSQVKSSNINIYKPSKQVFQGDSFEYIISKEFLDFHKQEQTPSVLYLISSKGEQDILEKWSDEIRKLKEIDKYTETQIKYIINFTIQDDFWKNQIQSIEKFRKKKDGISFFVKMIDKAKESQKQTIQPVNLKSEF